MEPGVLEELGDEAYGYGRDAERVIPLQGKERVGAWQGDWFDRVDLVFAGREDVELRLEMRRPVVADNAAAGGRL